MGRRKLRDIHKAQLISVRKKTKKEKLEKQKPTFKNLELDYDRVNDTNIELIITDIFDTNERDYRSLMLANHKTGSTFIITCIRCPLCNKPIELNKLWNSFICYGNKEHNKKCFEIKRAI